VNDPKIVCLCGSTRFKQAYEEAERAWTLGGFIVLTVGLFGHADGHALTDEQKARLDELHLRKIDRADSIYVLNVGGYIGESTRREIEYAIAHGKDVLYHEPLVQEEGTG